MQRYETDLRDGVLYLQAPATDAADADEDGTSGGGSPDASSEDAGDASDDPAVEWLEVGPMDDVVDLIGGEEYVLQYDERQRQVGWLDTDAEGRLTFDVRETVRTTDFDEDFAGAVASAPAGARAEDGVPKRAVVFADLLTTVWDAKGNL